MAKINVEVAESLPKDAVVIESAVIMKCLDAEGIPTLALRTSKGLATWDAVGLFTIAADMARNEAQQDFISMRQGND